jgi:hypothetical protein
MSEKNIHELLALRDECVLRLEALRAQAKAQQAADAYPEELQAEIDELTRKLDCICTTVRNEFPELYPHPAEGAEREVGGEGEP